MKTQIVFTLGDLGMFVIWALVTTLLVYVIMILARFYRSFKQIMRIADDHRENIDKILNEVPGITKNVNLISEEVAHGMGAFRGTVDNIAETTEAVSGAVSENKSAADAVARVLQIILTVKSVINRFLKKEEEHSREQENHE